MKESTMKWMTGAVLAMLGSAGAAHAADERIVAVELGAEAVAAGQAIKTATVAIRMPAASVGAGQPLLRLPLVISNVKTSAEDLQDLQVRDSRGPVPVTLRDDAPGAHPYRRWLAGRAVEGPLQVSYRIPISNAANPLGAAPPLELRSDGAVFSGSTGAFLVLPDNDEAFRLKLDWKLASQGAGALGVSTLGVGDRLAPKAAPSSQWESVFVMGGRLGNEPARPAADGFFSAWQGQPAFDARGLMRWTHDLYGYYLDFFQTPSATYNVFLRPNPINPGGGVEIGNSFVGTFDQKTDVDRFKVTLAHEMVHTFVDTLASGGLANSWFNEGIAVYYARLLALRAGKISQDDYLDDLNSTAARYYTDILNTTPNADIPARFWADTRVRVLPYDRGALYFAQLNDEIVRASNGKRSLDDLLLAFQARRRAGQPATTQAWVDAVVAEVGEEGRRQFEAMMAGRPIVLRPEAFGPCLRPTQVPLRRYELGFTPDVLVERRRIVRGLIPGSAAEQAGIRNGDEIVKPVPQDGIQADQKATLTLRVSRGGETRDITYLPRGETVVVPQWVAVSPSCKAAPNTAR